MKAHQEDCSPVRNSTVEQCAAGGEGPRAAESNSLRRVCFLLQVKPNRIEEYKQRHRNVWPEMLLALREAGWRNYSLFLRADGLLIGYLETEDFDRARSEIGRRDVNDRWQRQMAELFVRNDGLLPDQTMEVLEEVFHL